MNKELGEHQDFALRLRAALHARARVGPEDGGPPPLEAAFPTPMEPAERSSPARRTQRPVKTPAIGALELACRWLAAPFALIVAFLSLRPSNARLFDDLMAQGPAGQLDAWLDIMASATLAVLALTLIVRSDIARRLRMSWPLLTVILLCLGGLALLVSGDLRSALYATSSMLAQGMLPDSLRLDVDPGHMLTYLVFAVVVLIGWRRVRTGFLVLVLISFGLALELAQLAVPYREFSVEDLVANAMGIGIAVLTLRAFAQAPLKRDPADP